MYMDYTRLNRNTCKSQFYVGNIAFTLQKQTVMEMQLMMLAILFYNLFPFCSDDIWSTVATPHSIHYVNDQRRGGGEEGNVIAQQGSDSTVQINYPLCVCVYACV